jgi:hypothetical protein
MSLVIAPERPDSPDALSPRYELHLDEAVASA